MWLVKMQIKKLYWAAGFLEGEGSFYGNMHRLGVQANQVQREPLERLRALFGGNIRKQVGRSPNQSIINVWYVSGSRAVGVMMTLFVLMSPKRKVQIKWALEKWKLRPGRIWRGHKTHCSNGHEWTSENTKHILHNGRIKYKRCVTCYRAANTRMRERLKAVA